MDPVTVTTRPTRTKSNGARADGDRTPLNPNEAFKQEDDALNVRARIIDTYSHEGFDSIAEDDLTGRFRWMGLYTQRKPGLDGTHTGEDDISDSRFMMRVRSDGGQLTTEQVRTIAGISTDFARDTADISDRQNIQLHYVQIEDVPEIWRRLESVGLSTTEACGDCPRTMIASPVAGIEKDEIVDGTPALQEIKRKFIGNPEFSNLPRKYKTAISGSPTHDIAHEINDISFVGVVHPELGPGFDVWVGGGLSVKPIFAQRLGVWVSVDEVPEIWEGVTSIFRDHGYRRLRNKARLKFLMADWGPEKFREILENDYLGRRLPDGPEATVAPGTRRDHVGIHEQKDGRVWVGAAPIAGRMTGTKLTRPAELAEAVGSQRIRFTPHQKVLVLDVPRAAADQLAVDLKELDLEVHPSEWRRNVPACTGLEFCKLALTDTKNRARWTVEELEKRLPDMDVPFSIHLNGCPNACARSRVADVGLKGMLEQKEDGTYIEVFRVLLGGSLAEDTALARKTRALKVAGDDLPDYIERPARTYLAQRADGESFASWVRQADEDDIR
ncbi:nitrite/sulfite reductase [Janibacter limosus]|uniref:Nitrite/sulfite reductase n=1 Tax=Janibacter limosus TaxID=53458 RepID=A0AC61U0S9_9MICO|nr:nitrite/sulfite reductase [Janibacter limosus]UUZ43596.1 nitrite/sulfite reductase [Janibacter limosus]